MIVLIIITVIAVLIAGYCIKIKIKEDTATKEKNKIIREEYFNLAKERDIALNELNEIEDKLSDAKYDLDSTKSEITGWKNGAEKIIKAQEETSRKAFENYCDILENKYKEIEEEYNTHTNIMEVAYSNIQSKLIAETDEIRKELDKIRSTRAAAIEAARREELLKANSQDYCLQLSSSDLSDLRKIENFKLELNNERPLSMLVWTSIVSKPIKMLWGKILGSKQVTGIYKITCLPTGEVYIGQAVSVLDRWVSHAKCLCGIDVPANNKLYELRKKYPITSFAWELLEECPREQLDEKEKTYISLYDSYNNGLNSTRGNSTK